MKYFCSFLLLLPALLFAEYSDEHNDYLRTAVKYGNLEMARFALENNADPNINMLERNYLKVAQKAYYTNKEIMRLLITFGADKTPVLETAVRNSDIETCEFLEKEGTALNNKLLFYAEKIEMLDWLLGKNLDINSVRIIPGDYRTKRLLFNALFELTIGYGPGQDRVGFHPNYPMLELLKNYHVDTSLPVLGPYTIFELIDRDLELSAVEKIILKDRIRAEKPNLTK